MQNCKILLYKIATKAAGTGVSCCHRKIGNGGIALLEVKNIEKYYGSRNNVTKALDRVSFQVEDGDFLVIMGASGSGKTTLLNSISTIHTVSSGDILLDGVNISE